MLSRRDLMVVGAAAGVAPRSAFAAPVANGAGAIKPALLRAAIQSYQSHKDRLASHDYIGIADFSVASRLPRFHILDLASGRARALLVAHGRGSDPDHSGWLEKFSNEPGSAASSQGAYLPRISMRANMAVPSPPWARSPKQQCRTPRHRDPRGLVCRSTDDPGSWQAWP